MTNVIQPAGWSIWNTATPNTADVEFAEFGNTGAGSASSEGPRASFSEQLSAPISIETVLGSSYASQFYVDTSYLS